MIVATRYMVELTLDKIEELQRVAEALSNETRLQILQALRDHREINHQEIAKLIGKSSGTVSVHTKALVRAGILEDVKLKGLRGRIKKVPRFLVDEIIIKL